MLHFAPLEAGVLATSVMGTLGPSPSLPLVRGALGAGDLRPKKTFGPCFKVKPLSRAVPHGLFPVGLDRSRRKLCGPDHNRCRQAVPHGLFPVGLDLKPSEAL